MSLYLILSFSCSEYSINSEKNLNDGLNGGYGFGEQDVAGYLPRMLVRHLGRRRKLYNPHRVICDRWM